MTAFMIALHPNSIRTMQPGFFLPVFLLCLLLNQNAKATDAECASTASRLDWVNRDSLSPEQLLSLPVGCDGLFIEPADELITATDATESSGEITISGKDSQITKQSTLMTGDVILTQDGRKITGDNAELFNEPQGVTLSGNVSFREKGFLLRGDSASISLEQNTVEVDNAEYVLHQQRVHGEADHMKRDGTGLISLTGGSYSSCSPGDEFWSLRSSSMMLDTANSQGSAKNVRLEILDVPIFYFPYLLFPIGSKRHSGFLAPSISSSEDGLDVTLPYYFNLAPDYDATLIPRHISNRGTQIGGEVRHLSPQFLSSVSATWLPDDKLLNEDRWLLGIRQTSQGIKPWSTHIDIARVSDNDYFDDLDNSGLSVSRATHLQQYGSANYMTDNWLTEIEVEQYQTLRDSALDDPYAKLPSLMATGNYYLGSGFSTQLFQSLTRFDHSDTKQVTGDRIATNYKIQWRAETPAVYVQPAIGVQYLKQQLKNANDDSPEIFIPGFSLDTGLVLLRETSSYQQTLSPRIYYQYVDYKNQSDFQVFDTDEMDFNYAQLFRSNRFSGNDRIADKNQTSIGIDSGWQDLTTGREWLRIGIGQIFYHEDRRVSIYDAATLAQLPAEYRDRYSSKYSPIAGELQWIFDSRWQLNSELSWNQQEDYSEQGNVFLHYRGNRNELFSIGYRHIHLVSEHGTVPPCIVAPCYVQDVSRQGDISASRPLNNQWSIMGRLNYDFANKRNLETLAGFQYEDCCWRLRTVYRQWATNPDDVYSPSLHDQNQGIFLEIQLKNLTSLGTKTGDMLKDGIYGYENDD